jgi:hypothetical protein
MEQVRVRYTVLGRAESQLLPLSPVAAVRCA